MCWSQAPPFSKAARAPTGRISRRYATPPRSREGRRRRGVVQARRRNDRASIRDPRNPLALVPQPPRRQVVARGRARLGLAARYEIRAADERDVGQTCKMYDGLCATFRRAREQHREANYKSKNVSGPLTKTGRHESRMKAVRRHPGSGEAACEFAGEQDVGELGTAVGRHDAVSLGELQVLEIERAADMGR